MKATLAIEIDTGTLDNIADSHLASLWHVAQANPAPHCDRAAGQLAEDIGREIVRRWLRDTPPPLWDKQGNSYYWNELRKHGYWHEGKTYRLDPWQPIETAPADTEVLLATAGERGACIIHGTGFKSPDSGDWFDADATTPLKLTPSHWAPLPEPPRSSSLRAANQP
jgi:hypothetical protein